jgi:hypothetical protein
LKPPEFFGLSFKQTVVSIDSEDMFIGSLKQMYAGPCKDPRTATRNEKVAATAVRFYFAQRTGWFCAVLLLATSAFSQGTSAPPPPIVERELEAKHYVLLRADWTRYDPEITRQLASVSRSGVPTYVIYPAQPTAPVQVLPELLTRSAVLSALTQPQI